MDTNQHSFENFGLQRAAAAGDDEGVRQALHSGADVNALNIAGKTALMSAIAGDKYVFFPFILRDMIMKQSLSFQLGKSRRV
jgi:ankyrin repeat protein